MSGEGRRSARQQGAHRLRERCNFGDAGFVGKRLQPGEFDLHPDNLRLIAAAFQPRGQGGNGRSRAARTEYQDNVGTIKIYAMTERQGVRR